jgi:hypothetical protein
VKLGISHYNTCALVGVGDVKEVAVAQVSNLGNETLIIECVWKQEDGALPLPVTVKTPNQNLTSGASVEIFLIVATPNAEYIGNYSGTVEINGKLANPVSGSPIVPGGTVKVNFIVKYLTSATFVVYALTLTETEILEGEELHASVRVKNVGEIIGNYIFQVMVDGVPVENVSLTLDWNQTRRLDFALKMNQTGSHVLSIGNLSSVFNVKAKPEPEGVPPYLLVLCLVVGACNVVGFVFWRRQKATKQVKVETSEKGMWRVGSFEKFSLLLTFLIRRIPSKLGELM